MDATAARRERLLEYLVLLSADPSRNRTEIERLTELLAYHERALGIAPAPAGGTPWATTPSSIWASS